MTPEGAVKKAVTTLLIAVGCIPAGKAGEASDRNDGWYYMPVSNGMGVHGIPDIIGHYKGQFFSVETKVENKNPTPLQQLQLNAITASGGKAFVVRGVNDLKELRCWLYYTTTQEVLGNG